MQFGRASPLKASGHFRAAARPAPCAARPCSYRGTSSRLRCTKVYATQSLYDLLGVPQEASDRDIKKAFRQKALKLHPDVNKAPDAEQKFMEVKNAFTVLSDAKQRADYDRRLRMGSGGWGDFGGWGSTTSTSTSGSSGRRPTQQEEEFYGLADFFDDLEKEFDKWSKEKGKEGKPLSLFEELAAIGEEFVDYLEDSLGVKEAEAKQQAAKGSSSSGGSSSRPKSAVDEYEELLAKLGMKPGPGDEGSSSSSSSGSGSSRATESAKPPPPPPSPKKSAEDDIDDMLAALKKKMGKG